MPNSSGCSNLAKITVKTNPPMPLTIMLELLKAVFFRTFLAKCVMLTYKQISL
ncbi:MAG: hypothetical protein PHY36_00660 [Methanocellales archaeon]|nr:hypothetical protein [Methanocellales archaeon]